MASACVISGRVCLIERVIFGSERGRIATKQVFFLTRHSNRRFDRRWTDEKNSIPTDISVASHMQWLKFSHHWSRTAQARGGHARSFCPICRNQCALCEPLLLRHMLKDDGKHLWCQQLLACWVVHVLLLL